MAADPVAAPAAQPTVDVSDAAAPTDEDEAAARKREENRKKRERQKKKKAADKEAAADKGTGAAQGRWMTGALPGGRAERRDTGSGDTRGLGVFACECLRAGEVIAAAPPALSCCFDDTCEMVCSFCFAEPTPGATTEHSVTLRTPTAEGGSFGLKLDDYVAEGASAASEALITAVTKESPNRESVRIGDRLVSVDGQPVNGGHEAAVPMLLAGASALAGCVPCVVRRPELLVCPGCKKVASCAKCVGEGRLAWHAYECALYRSLPPQKGESATLRLLLRYKIATQPKIGDWPSSDKEPVSLLGSLQGNACDVPPDQLLQLSRLTAVPAPAVASLIYQVRTNACEVTRGGKKAGCALSVLMGWHNHDCAPNAQSVVAPDGRVTITALRDVTVDEEVTISYVDPKLDYEERRKVLQAHYGFECKCNRCVTEQRKELKTRMQQRGQYMQAQRR